MLSKVAIVGRPNTGKSTLFNRIIGSRLSITDDTPGVTRDRIYSRAEWLGHEFNLIDTGGIEIKDAPFKKEIQAQAEIAMEEADVIIMCCDGRTGTTDDDEYVAKILYKTDKPVILCVNKIDDSKFQDNIYEFYSLGFGDPIPVSSFHGVGLGDLLDKVIELLPNKTEKVKDDTIAFSVVGRPNVGKSSLVNAILNNQRVIVSNVAGTTTDAIDTPFRAYDKNYCVIDTAGLRKRGKIYENLEKYMVLRTIDAIERSSVVLLVLDASEGFIDQDKHVAQYIDEYNRPCIIVVNKWDTVEKDSNAMKEWEKKIRAEFKFLDYAPIVFLSALENTRVQTLFEPINQAFEAYHKRVSTSILNNVFADALAMFPPSEFHNGKPKFYYISQVGAEPPTFAIFLNEPNYVHFSYLRYIENQLRKNFNFYGTPIKLELRKRD
ncbi:MAG: ribosome biogenesis GTPase Der [Acholeplasmatales bacterium]|nr:ribosome biogenesis GTPase Der [Acholeplasmatales bacterium]